MNNIYNKKIETKNDYTIDISNGYYTFHEEKLICYVDLLGTSNYYNYLSKIKNRNEIKNEVINTFLKGFLDIFAKIDNDIYSRHVLSDSVIIVPKSKIKNNKTKLTYKKFFNEIIGIYCSLLLSKNPSKVIITQGQYFSIGLNDSNLNVLPGGKTISDCANADKIDLKEFGPGIYTDIKRFKINSNNKWDFLKISPLKHCFKNIPVNELFKKLNEIEDDFVNSNKDKINKRYNIIKNWLQKLDNK